MIQTGIKLKNIVHFLKEHLSLLIIVPAFIGGLWQALELMLMSISYIRFFSISQIVPDGILILIFLFFIFIMFSLGILGDTLFYLKGNKKPVKNSNEVDIEKVRKRDLKISIVLFFLLYIMSTYYYLSFMYEKSNFSEFKSDVAFSFLIILFLNIFLNSCFNLVTDKYKELIKICNFFLLFFYIILGSYIGLRMHNIFISPSNNINIEQVKNKVSHKFPNTKQVLLYFNDKYIFFNIYDKLGKDKNGKIIKDKKQYVYIVKLETLFDDK